VDGASIDHPLRARLRGRAGDFALVAVYVVAVVLFAPFSVEGDGTYYYDLTRHFVGDGGIVYAYQWGASLWLAPFYVVWHGLGLPASTSPPHAAGDPFVDPSVTVAASVAVVAAVLVARRVVVRLGLPCNTLLLIGTLFGTQLWVYGLIVPSYSHAIDALAFSSACYLAVIFWQEAAPVRVAALLGVVLACMVSIRYANVAAVPGFILPVLLRCDRRAIGALVGGAVAGAVLLVVPPLVADTGFGSSADLGRTEGGRGPGPLSGGADILENVTIPLKMLFSPERGLFVYAPICALALVGFVLALRRIGPNRVPLASMGVAGLGIVLVYVAVGGDWRGGGFTYGQRFLTSLAALTLIGLAELWRRAPRLTVALVVLGTAWSLFVGINFLYGWQGMTNDTRNASDIVRLYTSGTRSPWEFVRLTAFRLHDRFTG
jgi:hypothetical protein